MHRSCSYCGKLGLSSTCIAKERASMLQCSCCILVSQTPARAGSDTSFWSRSLDARMQRTCAPDLCCHVPARFLKLLQACVMGELNNNLLNLPLRGPQPQGSDGNITQKAIAGCKISTLESLCCAAKGVRQSPPGEFKACSSESSQTPPNCAHLCGCNYHNQDI